MRFLICSGTILLTGVSLFASKKIISPSTSAGNEQVDIIARIILAEDEVTQELGADPGKGIVLLKVRVVPKTDQPVQVSPDDFILLAHDDGERSKPFGPEEIAGAGRMVVSNTATAPTKKTEGFGGFGGMIGGGSGSSPGNSKPVALSSKVDSKSQGNTQLLDVLKAKELPETDAKDAVQGYLYFPLDGKHKLKNLAILYRGPAGKLNLEFEH
ncbi:MAG: hypothetical protein JO270_15145 [Acidobacteriaceae bacterium]|nr:hypothetical protein [Acidobacteriaceae bacterium]MBV8571221.1 hypothetical protein [Acidobacteriaceae bacterium]